MEMGGRIQMKKPQVAEALGVSLGGDEGAGAPTPAPSAPSASRGAGPLTVEQMKSFRFKMEAAGIVKGAFVKIQGGGAHEAWEVTDVTETTVHIADARAATKQRVGALAMPPKTVDITAELEKKTLSVQKGYKRQVAMQPCGVDLSGWDADIAIGICMRGLRVAHDKHCEVLAAIAILETPTAVYLTGALCLNSVVCVCVELQLDIHTHTRTHPGRRAAARCVRLTIHPGRRAAARAPKATTSTKKVSSRWWRPAPRSSRRTLARPGLTSRHRRSASEPSRCSAMACHHRHSTLPYCRTSPRARRRRSRGWCRTGRSPVSPTAAT